MTDKEHGHTIDPSDDDAYIIEDNELGESYVEYEDLEAILEEGLKR